MRQTKADLRFRIREMELEAVVQEKRDVQYRLHQEKMYELGKLEAVAVVREQFKVEKIKSDTEVARLREKSEQLEKRLAASNEEFLKDIMKALLVKFPTLNITDLAVTVASKDKVAASKDK